MRRLLSAMGPAMLASLVLVCPAAAGEGDSEKNFEGSVEVLYRNVNQDGSTPRYDYDFDGLSSGVRLSNLWADWSKFQSKLVDFLRVEASGLGGDPYERVAFRMGRRDAYEFSISHWSQTYLYDMFELVDDKDGSTWDSKRRFNDIDLTIHATDKIDVFFEFEEVERDGTSMFMKDINLDLFQLETPLDQDVKRYSIGGKFELGKVDLFFRQTLRRYNYQFNNTAEGNAGLNQDDLATLESYEWRQSDRGDADLTTLTVSVPFGDRVNLMVSAFGTLIGEWEIQSDVSLDAEGTSFRGTCSVTGAVCDRNNPCDTGVVGNVCVADPYAVTDGTSQADIETDYRVVDVDLSVKIVEPLDFHLQARRLDRETTAFQLRDLDGNGVPDDTEPTVNDTNPGSETRVDYTLGILTGLFDWAPSSKYRFLFGYRTIDRELERSGYEYSSTDFRNTPFEADDETVILGLVLKPVGWFLLDANYEKGDITQAFTAVAPMETDRLRVRARFEPRDRMRLDLSYLGFNKTNQGVDFRQNGNCSVPGSDIDDGCWNTDFEGRTYAASWWHKAGSKIDYWVRWARQDTDSVVRSRFDTDFFGVAQNGDSTYDNTSDEWAGQVNFNWATSWRGFVRFRVNDSDGNNDWAGTTIGNNLVIKQDYSDVEAGLTYAFTSGLYVGARYRVFDYEDTDDRMDYDGGIFTLLAGLDF